MYIVTKNTAKKAAIFLLWGLVSLSVPVGFVAYQHHLKVEKSKDPIGEMIRSLPPVPNLVAIKPIKLSASEEREVKWLARGIYFEARGEPVAGQLKVGEVIINRSRDSRWPKTIESVVRQGEERRNRCQFSFMCDGKPEKVTDDIFWKLAVDIAHYLYQKKLRGEETQTCAHSYHATYATNISYFQSLVEEEQVGLHKFFCDK